jgi:phosphoglycerate dehydrogenase-like enzyme
VQLCVALTDETRGLLGRSQFDLMRRGALVVNTARGALVDHTALAAALTSGQVGGYASDVWLPEPPAPDDAVLATGRVVVTPHVAAIADTTYREICVRPASGVVAVLGGRSPDPGTVFTG